MIKFHTDGLEPSRFSMRGDGPDSLILCRAQASRWVGRAAFFGAYARTSSYGINFMGFCPNFFGSSRLERGHDQMRLSPLCLRSARQRFDHLWAHAPPGAGPRQRRARLLTRQPARTRLQTAVDMAAL